MKRKAQEPVHGGTVSLDGIKFTIQPSHFKTFGYEPSNEFEDRYDYQFSESTTLNEQTANDLFSFINMLGKKTPLVDCLSLSGLYSWSIQMKLHLVIFMDKYFGHLVESKDYWQIMYAAGYHASIVPPDTNSSIIAEKAMASHPLNPHKAPTQEMKQSIIRIVDNGSVKEMYLSSERSVPLPKSFTIDAKIFTDDTILSDEYSIHKPQTVKQLLCSMKIYSLVTYLSEGFNCCSIRESTSFDTPLSFVLDAHSKSVLFDYLKLFDKNFLEYMEHFFNHVGSATNPMYCTLPTVCHFRHSLNLKIFPDPFKRSMSEGHVLASKFRSGPIHHDHYVDFIRGDYQALENDDIQVVDVDDCVE